MSNGENTKGLSALAGAGNPATSKVESPKQEPTTEPQEQDEPQFITRAEALKMIQQEATRISQSLTDKASARIQKEIDRLQKAGIEATPEQVRALVQAEADQQEEPARRQPTQARQQEGPPHPAIALAESRMKRAGIDPDNLTQDDPDFSMIDFEALNSDDDTTFLNSVDGFIAANKARKGSPARLPMAGNRTGGGSEAALVQELDRLVKESPSKNAKRIAEIGRQLKK